MILDPVWATGLVSPAQIRVFGHPHVLTSVSCVRLNDRPVAITGGMEPFAWDLVSGQRLDLPLASGLSGRRKSVACFDADGVPMAVSSDRSHLCLWNLRSGRLLRRIESHDIDAVAAGVAPNGRIIAMVGTGGQSVAFWDLTGTRPREHRVMTPQGVRIASFSLGDGSFAITGHTDGTAWIWDVNAGTTLGSPLPGQGGSSGAVGITTIDGRPVAVVCDEDSLTLWDLTDRAFVARIPTTGAVTALTFAAVDGEPIAVTGDENGVVRLFDLRRRRRLRADLVGHSDRIRAVVCTRIGDKVIAVSASFDGTARVWDLSTPLAIERPRVGHRDLVLAATVLGGEEQTAVTGGYDGVMLWDVRDGARRAGPFKTPARVDDAAAVWMDGQGLVATSSEGERRIRIWNPVTGTEHSTLVVMSGSHVTAIGHARVAGRGVLLAGGASSIRVLDLVDGEEICPPMRDRRGTVRSIATIDHGGVLLLAAARADHSVQVWQQRAGQWQSTVLGSHDGVRVISCTLLDGSPIAVTAGEDGVVRVWDMVNGGPVGAEMRGHIDLVEGLATVDLGGRALAISGGDDTTIRLWDIGRGECLEVMPMWDRVKVVACSPDGLVIAGAGWDVAAFKLRLSDEDS